MMVGTDAAFTVKVTPLGLSTGPPGVVTVKLRGPMVAPEVTMIERGILVSDLPAVLIVAATPLPEKLTALAPERIVPVIVAGKLLTP